jgi:RNA polymerase sigma factor (sigma-70 family)
MSRAWKALEALVELGWSAERERDVFAVEVSPAVVEANLDLLLRATAARRDAFAERVLTFALGVLDAGSDAAVRLRNQLSVVAAGAGRYAVARAGLEDAHIDAARICSRWTGTVRVNLASTAFADGDVAAARRWLALAERTGRSDAGVEVAAAAIGLAGARLSSDADELRHAVERLGEAEAAYRAVTGPGAPTALVASAATTTGRFDLAMAEGATDLAEELAERVDLLRQRIATALGADHFDTLTVRLNLSTMDFRLARASRSSREVNQALATLSATATRIEQVLGAHHPLALVAAGNAASARFECARLARSVTTASSALVAMRKVAENTSRHLGENHPHTMSAYANLATALFELARSAEAHVGATDALEALESACARAEAVLGPVHATTRVLRHELRLCREWNEQQQDRGRGGLRTKPRLATDAAFDGEYVSFEQARDLLDAPRPDVPHPEDTHDIDPDIARVWRRYGTSRSQHAHEELMLHYAPVVVAVVGRFRHGVLANVKLSTLGHMGVLGLAEAVETHDAAFLGRGFEAHATALVGRRLMSGDHVTRFTNRSLERTVTKVLRLLHEEDQPSAAAAPVVVAGQQERDRLTRLIAVLPADDRTILTLRYLEGMTVAQVAALLGMSTARVTYLQGIALGRLRALLDRDE